MKRKRLPLLIGRNVVLEALEEGKSFDKIFIQKGLNDDKIKAITSACKERKVPVSRVPSEKLYRFSNGNHQGVVAIISEIEYADYEHIIPLIYEKGEVPLILILDGVTDVRNLGGIARSAEVMGAHMIITPLKNSAPVNAEAIQASAGALMRIPVCRTLHWHSMLDYLQKNGIRLFAAEGDSQKELKEANFKGPCAIILGDEGEGINEKTLERVDQQIKITQHGKTESLNVSVACGIILYEVATQREA